MCKVAARNMSNIKYKTILSVYETCFHSLTYSAWKSGTVVYGTAVLLVTYLALKQPPEGIASVSCRSISFYDVRALFQQGSPQSLTNTFLFHWGHLEGSGRCGWQWSVHFASRGVILVPFFHYIPFLGREAPCFSGFSHAISHINNGNTQGGRVYTIIIMLVSLF